MILPVLEERKLQDWKKQGHVPAEKLCANEGYFKEHTIWGGRSTNAEIADVRAEGS